MAFDSGQLAGSWSQSAAVFVKAGVAGLAAHEEQMV